jgi:glycosyltransferase involved in cell wall biosynthesis
MSLDCPVICSNSSSLPEVVGDAAGLFDPGDRDDIRRAMTDVLSSPSRTEHLRERGQARRQLFSWKKCAEKTVEIYRRALRA